MGGRSSKVKRNEDAAGDSNEDDFISFLDAASDGNFTDSESGKGVKEIYERSSNILGQQLLLF
jgi:hypothetical protein